MKNVLIKTVVLATAIAAASGITARNYDGPPTPVCTPTGCQAPLPQAPAPKLQS